jgi:Tol biopolymer transport system component
MNTFIRFLPVRTILSLIGLSFCITVTMSGASVARSKEGAPKPAASTAVKSALPLVPERKVEFSTDEGTWLSLDVSPDGKTIIFELLGHLYAVSIAGGGAKAITSGVSFNSQPRFSPDGKRIAFISDRGGAENLWIADTDGSNARQLSKDEQSEFASPAWLPDGNFVVVSRQTQLPTANFELWAYHLKGGSGFAVVKSKDKPDTPPEHWHHTVGAVASPDGKYLYYAQREGFFDKVYNVSFPLSQIARRDRRTGDEDVITDAPGSAFCPVLSPDGTKLAYGTRYETETLLKIRDLKSGEEKRLKYPVQRDDQESIFTRDFLPGYAFTPDGKEVVIAYGGKIHRVDAETGEEHLVPFVAKVSRDLGPLLDFPERIDEGPVKSRLIQGPVQSPDGKRFAFSALTHLYVMDLPDGKPMRVTKSNDHEYQPAWSPDGQWLAFVTWSPQGGEIWKVRADGCCAPEQLTQIPAYYRDAVWTPDGERLVALRGSRQWQLEKVDEWSGPGALLDLIWLPAQGGPASLIMPARGASSPHFVASQKDRVYVYTRQGLTSVRFDGTDRQTHLKVSGKKWFPEPGSSDDSVPADDVRMSPDGQWVVARVSSQLYLIPAPSFGGGAQALGGRSGSRKAQRRRQRERCQPSRGPKRKSARGKNHEHWRGFLRLGRRRENTNLGTRS